MRDTLAPPDPNTLSALPMFPLPNCVLLPGGCCRCTCSSRGTASSRAIVSRGTSHGRRPAPARLRDSQTIAASGRPEEDLKTLAAIREMVGDRIELRFDGMGRYDLETARDLAAGMESHELQFFLDPLNTRELHPVASLGRQTSVPLAVWRAIRSPADVLTAVRCNAAPFLMVDLEQVGGIVPARACAAVAAAAGVVPVLGGRPSVGIATAAMLHLAAATAAFSTSNELASRQLRDTVLADSLEITDGMITVPQALGLGVTVDRAKVERYQASVVQRGRPM